jgi:hypothetical protein
MSITTKLEVIKNLALGDKPSLSLAEILTRFNKVLDNSFISWKPIFKNGKQVNSVAYISWTDLSLLLDYYCDAWEVDFKENQVGNFAVVKCILTIKGNDGLGKTVSSLGNESLDSPEAFGGALADAQAMSFRRAAALLGLGRYLYYPELACHPSNKKSS